MINQLLLKFLQFRIKQTGRLCQETGLVRVFLLITILLFFAIFNATYFLHEHGILLTLFYPLLVLPIHFYRKDQAFLRKLTLPKEAIFAAEYHALVLPYSFLLIYYQRWEVILLGHILITLSIFLPSISTEKKSFSKIPLVTWIPDQLFEWHCYLRQRKFFLFICYLITAFSSFYTYAVPVGIFIFLLALPEVYNYLESKELIETYPKYSSFLWSKLKDHSLFIHLAFTPLYLLFLLFHYELWYIFIFLLLIVESTICFCLFYKYSRFQTSTSEIHNQIPFAIFFITILLFFPVGVFFVYLYWKKASKMLSKYVGN